MAEVPDRAGILGQAKAPAADPLATGAFVRSDELAALRGSRSEMRAPSRPDGA